MAAYNVHLAHCPHGTHAGAGSVFTWPSWAAILAQRPQICDKCRQRTFSRQLAAQRTWTRRRPLLFTHVTRDRGICQGIDADDEWSRLSHLGSSESVLHEQAAAVHAAAEHHVTALVKQVSHSLTVAHVWVGDRAHGTGKLGTDAGDTAEVLTDGFSA